VQILPRQPLAGNWLELPVTIRERLAFEGVRSSDDWRALGRKRKQIFGVTPKMVTQLDQLADLPRPTARIRPRTRRHRCFELTARIQWDDPTWTLVHGIVQSCTEHAWLSRDGVVYDAVLDKSFTAEDYVARFDAQEVASYDVRAASELLARVGSYCYLPTCKGEAR
jgi:hypothetical protein